MSEVSTAEAVREKVLAESAGRCCVCAAHVGFQVEVVPVTPLNEGGPYNPSNLAVLCPFCRWLVQRQKVSPTALRTFRKNWLVVARKAPKAYHEGGLIIQGQPLRLEAVHHGALTVLEGSELSTLLANFFNCLDTFLIHEDQHLENAASLAVIRAFRDMYNYVPPERDIKDMATADSRKLDLLYRGIRAMFSVGMSGKAKAAKSKETKPTLARPSAGKKPTRPAALRKKAAARKQGRPKPPAARGRRK